MKPFYITLFTDQHLMVIPDSQAHLDGHTIITFSYSLYNYVKVDGDELFAIESKLHLEKKNDPDYRGYINFDAPGRSYSYIADNCEPFDSEEIVEIIEQISHYRDNPSLWGDLKI